MTTSNTTSSEFHHLSGRVAIVRAGWHAEIVNAFSDSCRRHLAELCPALAVREFEVPGVVEIPLFTSKLIKRRGADIVIVTGLIADHGVYRHDFVARTVMDATMQVQLQTEIPVIYGILTPQDFLSEGREEFFRAHFVKKGIEAAECCLKTLSNERVLAELCPVA